MAKLGLLAAGRAEMAASTVVILLGIALTSVATLGQDHAVDVFTVAAVGVGLSLSLATALEARPGLRNLIRADILLLWALYGLTLLEFLFPQPGIDGVLSTDAAMSGADAVLLGFAGLAVGRHLVSSRQTPTFINPQPPNIFLLFVLAAVLGYFHIFLAVNFDPLEVLRQISLPRGYQSWARGKYGDASALLYEVGALIYLIPPIAGLIYARSKNYNIRQKVLVTIVALFTFYYGFALGTRSVFAIYVITFLGAYFLAKPKITLNQILFRGMPIIILSVIGTVYMLEFRNLGLSNFSFQESTLNTIYIDHNLVVISQLTDVFPSSYEFLGLEIPFNALIHPIPRILWPGKPEGLSVSIESAVHADSFVTVAATFIGEAYMAGGLTAVLFASLLFGAAAEKWNRIARNTTLPFPVLLYASGFICLATSMRSLLWVLPTMLPTLALWLYGKFCFGRASRRRSAAVIGPVKAQART
jgi:oligosaccharide repeat unit polymerase